VSCRHELTPAGLKYLLQPTPEQVWLLLREYIRVAERTSGAATTPDQLPTILHQYSSCHCSTCAVYVVKRCIFGMQASCCANIVCWSLVLALCCQRGQVVDCVATLCCRQGAGVHAEFPDAAELQACVAALPPCGAHTSGAGHCRTHVAAGPCGDMQAGVQHSTAWSGMMLCSCSMQPAFWTNCSFAHSSALVDMCSRA
jgi:hypothetical protein